MSGPQFEGQKEQGVMGWIHQNRSKTIAGIIALIALIGGLYLFNSDGNNNPASVINGGDDQKTIQNAEEQDQDATEANSRDNQQVVPPAETVTNEAIKETAQSGQGITHLARRAAKTYIDQNSNLKDKISKEQKIFIEDYLKDRIKEGLGKTTIEINEEIGFDKNLIQEAINASEQLTENQLNNLTKYANLVPSL